MCGPLANYNNNIFIFLSKIVYIKRAIKKFTVIDAFYDAMHFCPSRYKIYNASERLVLFFSCLLVFSRYRVLFALYFYKLFTRWLDATRYTHTPARVSRPLDRRPRRISVSGVYHAYESTKKKM